MKDNSKILNYFYEKDADLSKREQIAIRLKALRNNAGLTQKQFAQRHGFSNSSVSSWERPDGNNIIPSLDKLVTLADYYDCDIAYLLGETGPSFDVPTISIKLIQEATGLSGTALQIIQHEVEASKEDLKAHNELLREDYEYELEHLQRIKTTSDTSEYLCEDSDSDSDFCSPAEQESAISFYESKLKKAEDMYRNETLTDWKQIRSFRLRFIDFLIRNTDALLKQIFEYDHLIRSLSNLEARDDYNDIVHIFNSMEDKTLRIPYMNPDGVVSSAETEFFHLMAAFYRDKFLAKEKKENEYIKSILPDTPLGHQKRQELDESYTQLEEIPSMAFNEINYTDTYNLLKNGDRDIRALEFDLSNKFIDLIKSFLKEIS